MTKADFLVVKIDIRSIILGFRKGAICMITIFRKGILGIVGDL